MPGRGNFEGKTGVWIGMPLRTFKEIFSWAVTWYSKDPESIYHEFCKNTSVTTKYGERLKFQVQHLNILKKSTVFLKRTLFFPSGVV